MLHELRDLDGEIVVRQQSSTEGYALTITHTEAERTIRIEGLEAILILRELCDEIIEDAGPQPALEDDS